MTTVTNRRFSERLRLWDKARGVLVPWDAASLQPARSGAPKCEEPHGNPMGISSHVNIPCFSRNVAFDIDISCKAHLISTVQPPEGYSHQKQGQNRYIIKHQFFS